MRSPTHDVLRVLAAILLCSHPGFAQDSDDPYGDPASSETEEKERDTEAKPPPDDDSPPPPPPPADPRTVEARKHFDRGAQLVRKAGWSEALAAFETSAKAKPHAVTTHNIGACLRAMGRYVMARKAFDAALKQHDMGQGQLSDRVHTETRGYLSQIDKLLARIEVELKPASAAIAVDGRPLERQPGQGARPVLLAGALPPGPGKPPPAASFDILVDPGAHVITLSRIGFRDSVVNRTFHPGTVTELGLEIDRLPAKLLISANRDRSIVKVDGSDVGFAPVELIRPGGSYDVVVEKRGFMPYETRATVHPGEQVRIRARLAEEKPALYERWWFWGAVGVVVSGAVVGTYYATRPEPTRPAPNGGGLGWVIEAP